MSEKEILDIMNKMCIETLPPDIHDKWEEVKHWLEKTRKALKE